MTDRDARRLASYDAIVGASLAWRVVSRAEEFAHTTYDNEAINTARRTLHAHGKQIVGNSIVRQLARVYREGNP